MLGYWSIGVRFVGAGLTRGPGMDVGRNNGYLLFR